jgi:putative endonuclease
MEHSKVAQKWFLYLIENRLGHLYTGITTDYRRRFAEHTEDGKKCAKSLRGKGPLTLKYCVILNSHSDALKAELSVKKLTKQQKLTLISGALELPDAIRIQHTEKDTASAD